MTTLDLAREHLARAEAAHAKYSSSYTWGQVEGLRQLVADAEKNEEQQ